MEEVHISPRQDCVGVMNRRCEMVGLWHFGECKRVRRFESLDTLETRLN